MIITAMLSGKKCILKWMRKCTVNTQIPASQGEESVTELHTEICLAVNLHRNVHAKEGSHHVASRQHYKPGNMNAAH